MHLRLFSACILLFWTIHTQAQTIQSIIDKNMPYNYVLHLPKGYEQDSAKQYPLLLFLHGRSSSGTDLERVKRYGVIYEIARGMELDFVVLAPQCQSGWDSERLIRLLDTAQVLYRVNPRQTYLTGMSMGGYGAWFLAGDYPDRFAALAPVCGGGDARDAEKLVPLPTWVFHGALDKAVPLSESQKMVNAIKAKKGEQIQLTIYPKDGHSELVKVFRMKELYQWFLKHELRG